MISIHRVSQIRARTMPEQRWVELTFNQGHDEAAYITVYFNSVEMAQRFFETMPVISTPEDEVLPFTDGSR